MLWEKSQNWTSELFSVTVCNHTTPCPCSVWFINDKLTWYHPWTICSVFSQLHFIFCLSTFKTDNTCVSPKCGFPFKGNKYFIDLFFVFFFLSCFAKRFEMHNCFCKSIFKHASMSLWGITRYKWVNKYLIQVGAY